MKMLKSIAVTSGILFGAVTLSAQDQQQAPAPKPQPQQKEQIIPEQKGDQQQAPQGYEKQKPTQKNPQQHCRGGKCRRHLLPWRN